MTSPPEKKLKRVVIKEELVALTGDHYQALILNQLLYWMERTKDFDQFLEDEKKRLASEGRSAGDIQSTHGWIYKSADELTEELMLNVSPETVRSYTKKLVDRGLVDKRHNPNHKWDRTLQYRPNIAKIQAELADLGYHLEGYPIPNNLECIPESLESNPDILEAIPEITTETTLKNSADADFDDWTWNGDGKLEDSGLKERLTNGHVSSDDLANAIGITAFQNQESSQIADPTAVDPNIALDETLELWSRRLDINIDDIPENDIRKFQKLIKEFGILEWRAGWARLMSTDKSANPDFHWKNWSSPYSTALKTDLRLCILQIRKLRTREEERKQRQLKQQEEALQSLPAQWAGLAAS